MTIALLLALLAAEPNGRVEGQVLHALTGEPVRKATVTLQTGTPYDWGASLLTDADGRFAFDKLSPGVYGIHATKSGFLSGRHASRRGTGDLPTLRGKEGEALAPQILWLHPSAMLGGKVLGEDGEAMDSILVNAWRRHFVNGREHWLLFASAEAKPTRKGRQQFPVRIGDHNFDYHRTFYPSGTRIKDAQPFSLRAGQSDNSVLIQLRREPVTQLVGRFASASAPPFDVYGFLRRIPEETDTSTDTSTGLEPDTQHFGLNAADGGFLIPGLGVGTYELCVAANGPGPTRVLGRARVTLSGATITRGNSADRLDESSSPSLLRRAPAGGCEGAAHDDSWHRELRFPERPLSLSLRTRSRRLHLASQSAAHLLPSGNLAFSPSLLHQGHPSQRRCDPGDSDANPRSRRGRVADPPLQPHRAV